MLNLYPGAETARDLQMICQRDKLIGCQSSVRASIEQVACPARVLLRVQTGNTGELPG